MSSLDSTSSEMVMVDEQVVACEVEIDGFDVQYEQEEVEETGEFQHHQDESVEAGDYYQYTDEVDPESLYLFDGDTEQIHQLNPADFESKTIPQHHHHHRMNEVVEEREIDVEYVADQGPSTSSAEPSTSSQESTGIRQNTYYIRKTLPSGKPIYTPMTFHASYTEAGTRRKRVFKTTLEPRTIEEIDAHMEERQVEKRLQAEITTLRKENDAMKKEYEAAHKRLDSISMVWNEARAKSRAANEEKKMLHRDLAVAKSAHSQVLKQFATHRPSPPGVPYRFQDS